MQNNVAIDQKLHMFLSCLPQNEVEEITSPHKDISESLLLFNSFKANWPASVTDIDCVFFDRIDRNVTYIARVDRKKAVCKEGVLTLVHIFLPCSDHAYLARIAKTNDNDKQRRDDALASETAASLKTAIKDFVVQHNMVSAGKKKDMLLLHELSLSP